MQFTFGKIQIDLTPSEMKLVHDEYEKILSESPHSTPSPESTQNPLSAFDEPDDDFGDRLAWDNQNFPVSGESVQPKHELYIEGYADKRNHGGWRAELKNEAGETVSVNFDIEKDTGLGRMKLCALIYGLNLESVKSIPLKIHFNCQSIVDVITSGELEKWASEGWTREGAPVKNKDLWEKLYETLKGRSLEFVPAEEESEESKYVMENIKTLIILDVKRIAA